MGESSRLYIYSFDQQEPDEHMEEQIDTNSEQQKTRKERMLKLYEENKAQQETFQKNVTTDRVGWGIKPDQDDAAAGDQANSSALISDEDIKLLGLQFGKQINYNLLRERKELTDVQKAEIKKAEASIKRIEKLTKELDGIQTKQAQMLDLTEGQQQRLFKIEQELEEIRENLDNQEENIRNMIGKRSHINMYS
jgi:hypothetical protein